MRRWVAMPVLAVACGGTGTPPPRPAPATPPVSIAPMPRAATVVAPETSPGPPLVTGYAASPLTPLADELTRLVVTLIDGHPPPPGPLPLDRSRPLKKLLRDEHGAPKSRDLQFIGVGFELDMVLVAADPDGPADAEPDGTLAALVLVSSRGAKLTSLDVRSARAPRRLENWLLGARQQGEAFVEAIAAGRWNEISLGETERPLFENDAVFQKLLDELPTPEEKKRAEALARAYRKPLGFRMDDVVVIARDASGTFWGFALQLDQRDGKTVLDTSPLVRVEKLDPKEGL